MYSIKVVDFIQNVNVSKISELLPDDTERRPVDLRTPSYEHNPLLLSPRHLTMYNNVYIPNICIVLQLCTMQRPICRILQRVEDTYMCWEGRESSWFEFFSSTTFAVLHDFVILTFIMKTSHVNENNFLYRFLKIKRKKGWKFM